MALREYTVEITETLSKLIKIKAETEEIALEKVEQQYIDEKIVLYPEDHVETTFVLNN